MQYSVNSQEFDGDEGYEAPNRAWQDLNISELSKKIGPRLGRSTSSVGSKVQGEWPIRSLFIEPIDPLISPATGGSLTSLIAPYLPVSYCIKRLCIWAPEYRIYLER